jgi:hypothetical protein
MSFHHIARSSHGMGRGLFVLGSSAEANAAVARALKAAGVPKTCVLKVHVPPPRTARTLVRSIGEAAGLMINPSMSLFGMSERCLLAVRDRRILHIDGLHSAGDQLRSKVDTDLCDDRFQFFLKSRGISLIINGPYRMTAFEGRYELVRRFRFVSACDIGPNDAAYLLGGM